MDITKHDKILRFAYFSLSASKFKRGFPEHYIVDGVFNIDLWLQKNRSGILNENIREINKLIDYCSPYCLHSAREIHENQYCSTFSQIYDSLCSDVYASSSFLFMWRTLGHSKTSEIINSCSQFHFFESEKQPFIFGAPLFNGSKIRILCNQIKPLQETASSTW